MINTEQIEIPLSKLKLSLMLAGSVAFVACGVWFVTKPKEISIMQGLHPNPMLVFTVGVASILFFSLCAVFIAKKIMENLPGLVINNEGLNDNSSGTSAGLILWKNIKEIKANKVANQNFIIIIVTNPEEYINKQKSFIKRKAMGMNFKSYESPIAISANGLKCNFDELNKTLVDAYKTYKSKV